MYKPAGALGDPNAYRAIFFEETQDHLADVEAILLRLAPEQPYLDDLNAIFRAVHSIKGSAAMLGCGDMAALAHLQENLLDLLRKEERPLEPADVEAMLKAGDVVRAQALVHRGVQAQAPDSEPVEALLREQLARPRTDSKGAAAGPLIRHFIVRLSPLAQPIPDEELDMMIGGLAEMGTVSQQAIDNSAGGSIGFEVKLEGTAADLHSVLSLLVAPEIISIEKAGAQAPAIAPAQAAAAFLDIGDEFFVDPEEFRRKREARAPSAKADAPVLAQAAAVATPAAAPAASTPPRAASEAAETQIVHSPDTGHIRVATEKIDLLVNLVGELVITEAMLARSGQLEGAGNGATATLLESGLADLSRHTRNLQEAVLAIRMLPISHAFSRFPRIVHELSTRLGKRVELKFAGEATEVDRGLIEKISDPLTHLVRNAIDHGLETPAVREAAGKPPVGALRLQARQRGGNIVIEVSDDGRGLDRARILEQAARNGLAVPPPDAPDEDVWQLIFEPGLTTAEQVTDLSGRGVGMDVVRRNIKALGGTIVLASSEGWGTTVTVSVPLTLAIIEAMIVAIGDAIYVLPLATVVESLSVEPGDIHTLPGKGNTLRVREAYLPVLRLADIFPPRTPSTDARGIAVIVEADGNHCALIVDEVVGQQQVVVKSLEANFRKVPGLSAATVMGDGSVALILDVSHIVRMS
jgi:two-component system, chemotaxis family, sensor kinase CheA